MTGKFRLVKPYAKQMYHSSYLLFMNLAIISFVLLVLNNFYLIDINLILGQEWFFSIAIFSSLISIISKYKLNGLKNKKSPLIESIFQIAPYFFLAVLAVITLNQFLDLAFLSGRGIHFTVLGIAFGFLAFYKNRDRVEKELDDEMKSEELAEKKRESEFASRYPRINRIWGMRSIVKWMYKEGWAYSLALIGIVLAGSCLRLYSISNLSLWHDEALSVLVANQIGKYLLPVFLSGEFYWRALPYHYLMSFFLSLSENTNLFSRLVNLPFFFISGLMLYLISKRILKSKLTGIISLIFYSLSPFCISMFREARFYEFYLAGYLVFMYFTLITLVLFFSKEGQKNSWLLLNQFKSRIFFLFLLGILLIFTSWGFSYILYSLFFCGIIFSIVDKKGCRFWLTISLISFVLFTLGLLIYNQGNFPIIEYFIQNNVEWKGNLSLRPFGDFSNFILQGDIYFLILFIALSVVFISIYRGSISNNYLLLLVFSLAPYIILESQGFGIYAPRYFYNYFVPLLIPIAFLFYVFFILFKNKSKKFVGWILIIVLILPMVPMAYNESKSPNELNSIIDIKNNNLDEMFEFVLENYGSEYSIFSDSHTAVAFYVYSERLPERMLFEDKRIATENNQTDRFLNVKYQSVEEITLPDKKVVFLMWHSPGNLDSEIVDKFDSRGKLVYKQGAKRVYVFEP